MAQYRPFDVKIPSAYSGKSYRLTGNVPTDPSTIRMDATPWAPEMRETRDGTMMPWIDNPTTGEGFFVTPEKMQEGLDVNQYAPGPWWGKGYGAGVTPDFAKGIIPGDDWSRFNDYDAPWFKELQANYDQLRNDYATNEYLGDQSVLGNLKGFAQDMLVNAGPVTLPILGGLAANLAGFGGAGAGTAGPGWTSGYDLAGGGAFGGVGGVGAGAGTLTDLVSQVPTSGLTGGGSTATGADVIGSDWAAGAATGPVGGTLPTTAGGLTAANTAAGAAGATGTAATTAAGSGAKQWIADKLGIPVGAVDALGIGASTLMSLYQNSQNAGNAQDLANQFANYGAPSRERYENTFKRNADGTPAFSMMNDPGYADALAQTSDTLLRRLSAQGGNPFGNPGGLIEANKQINASLALPALQNYRNQNASTGGFGAFNTAAPGAMANASGQDNNWLTTLAQGVGSIVNRPESGEQGILNAIRMAKQYGLV